MKKGRYIMLSICVVFFALTLGTFLGRNVTHMHEIPGSAQRIDEANVQHLDSSLPDINLMSKAQLVSLPGIGETLADRIIAYREANGPFQTIEDLQNVVGIGEKKLDQIAGLVGVGG
jgi:competence protein ComEA